MKATRSPSSRSAGFTLMEMVVVVLLVGMLASVALPQYRRVVEQSYQTEAFTNLRSLINGAQVYAQRNGSFTYDPAALNVSNPNLNPTRKFHYYMGDWGGGPNIGMHLYAYAAPNAAGVQSFWLLCCYNCGTEQQYIRGYIYCPYDPGRSCTGAWIDQNF